MIGCEKLMQGIVPFGCMEDRKTCSCRNNPNCLYKQLKRKEQECEKLKKERDSFMSIIDLYTQRFEIYERMLNHFKVENNVLNKINESAVEK